MNMIPELHFAWLICALAILTIGACLVWNQKDAFKAWRNSVIFSGASLFLALGAWFDFMTLQVNQAHDRWPILTSWLSEEFLVLDKLNGPLIPLAALLHFLVILMTPATIRKRFPFSCALLSEAILLGLLTCQEPWQIITLLALLCIPAYLDLKKRGRSTRIFLIHSGLCVLLMITGWTLIGANQDGVAASMGMAFLILGILIRSGSIPVHCWMTDLFENASFGMALLYVCPMAGTYAAVRLVFPYASNGMLNLLGLLALITSVYAAGMTLVQKEARRFFCYLFLSHSSLVLVGLEIVSPIGMAGALWVWVSVGICLSGFGLVLRAVESRTGRLSLLDYHGLYNHMPLLAGCFLLTGLASIGFPGSIGFIGTEMLIEGVVSAFPHTGFLVLITMAFNGIAVMSVYFKIFTGTVHTATISLQIRPTEKIAVWTFCALIIGGGLFPQWGVDSRYHAAKEILAHRQLHQDENVKDTDSLKNTHAPN